MAFQKGNKWGLGKKMSEETKLKISLANRGKKRTTDMRANYSNAKLGTSWPELSKKKMLGNKNGAGSNRSEEHKKIISDCHKGKKYFLGKHHTEEVKKAMRLRIPWNKGKKYFIIENRELLKKDRQHMYDTQYKSWMLSVKIRDSWRCCMNSNSCYGRLEAHHIFNWKDFPALRYSMQNGITLCKAHHPRGRKNEVEMAPVLLKIIKKIKT